MGEVPEGWLKETIQPSLRDSPRVNPIPSTMCWAIFVPPWRDLPQMKFQGRQPAHVFPMGIPKAFLPVVAVTLALLALAGCALDDPPISTPGAQPQAAAPALRHAEKAKASGKASSPAPVVAAKQDIPSAPGTPPAVTPGEEQELIHEVDLAYESGVNNYHAGKLGAAKVDFDRAVDLMVTSKFDVKNDPALNSEFNRIIDGVNGLEMEALKQGNGFAPKIEPAPVDIANDVTFPVDPNIKAQAIAELKTTQSDLPLVINDPVAGYINYFSSHGRGHFAAFP